MNNSSLNRNCVIRLFSYKNALNRLKSLGFIKVFSENLADAVGGNSTQVRKDFSLFGITGNKKGGYVIDSLIESLNSILGKNELYRVVIVGGGNIGTALRNYKGFEKEGIKIVAVFDIDISKQQKTGEVPILPLEDLVGFVAENKIEIGIIATPEAGAQRALDLMLSAGIKGVLNFAPIRLRAGEEIVVNNINLGIELENVIYLVNVMGKQKGLTHHR